MIRFYRKTSFFVVLGIRILVRLICNGIVICFAVLTLPIYLNSEKCLARDLQVHDIECAILSALRIARFDRTVKDGTLTAEELRTRVQEALQEEMEKGLYELALKHLIDEEAVTMYTIDAVIFLDGERCMQGVVLMRFFKLNEHTDYRPRKPKRHKEKKEQLVHAHA